MAKKKSTKASRRKQFDLLNEVGKAIKAHDEQRRMPARLPNDPREVTLLLDESERLTALANKWLVSRNPNPIAANFCMQNGFSMALAASFLRCKLAGLLLPESGDK